MPCLKTTHEDYCSGNKPLRIMESHTRCWKPRCYIGYEYQRTVVNALIKSPPMSTAPYRVSGYRSTTLPQHNSAHPTPPRKSLTHQTTVPFIEMPGTEGRLCIDMYGDVPFGTYVLQNATLRGREAYIFTNDGVPIEEQNADFLRKKRFLKPRITEQHLSLQTIREVGDLVSLTSRCDTGFFHWMMDSLPKVVIAEVCGFTGNYLIPSPLAAPWAAESLEILGISLDRVVHHTDADIRARRLFIPTYFSGYNAHHNAPFMKIYREAIRQKLQVLPHHVQERVLIARKPGTKVRRIVNQEEVIQTTKAFGFKPLYFEDLSLRDQLQQALSADAILGAHGAGLCHSLFMNERSTIIELFPFARRQSCDCYETLSSIPQHRYHALESSEDREGDIVVSTDKLRVMLEHALEK